MRRSAIIFAPSAFRSFPPKLQTRVERTRQRVLTSGIRMRGGVLEGLQGGIRLECLCHVCCSLRLQRVVTEAANESRMDVSGGADGRHRGIWGGVLKGGEGLVLPEALGQVLGGFSVEAIHCQAANESRIEASGAADGKERGVRRRT